MGDEKDQLDRGLGEGVPVQRPWGGHSREMEEAGSLQQRMRERVGGGGEARRLLGPILPGTINHGEFEVSLAAM